LEEAVFIEPLAVTTKKATSPKGASILKPTDLNTIYDKLSFPPVQDSKGEQPIFYQ
jgi:hypothetical protein